MGYSNAQLVYLRWAHLPHRTFRLVEYMALVSLDSDAVPRCWIGRETLARAIGRNLPDAPPDTDKSPRAEAIRGMRATDFRALKETVQDAVKYGAITLEQRARPGRSAVYVLSLALADGRSETSEQGGLKPPMGRSETSNGDGSNLPQEEVHKSRAGENHPPKSGTSPAADLSYSQALKILDSLPDLGASYISRVSETVISLPDRRIAAAALWLSEHPGEWRAAQ